MSTTENVETINIRVVNSKGFEDFNLPLAKAKAFLRDQIQGTGKWAYIDSVQTNLDEMNDELLLNSKSIILMSALVGGGPDKLPDSPPTFIIKMSYGQIMELVDIANDHPSEEVIVGIAGIIIRDEAIYKEVRVAYLHELPNIAKNPQLGFVADPDRTLQFLNETTLMNSEADLSFIGFMHSHPFTAAYPSTTDTRNATLAGFYLIYSIRDNDVRAFYSFGETKKEPWSHKADGSHGFENATIILS